MARNFGRLVGSILLAAACAAAPAAASQESRGRVERGAAELAGKRFGAALEAFQAAEAADPSDAEASFFSGVALNRLGRSAEALERLERARRAGFKHPDSDFELGWSQLNLRRWQAAIESLEKYEREFPGRAQTSEFLGRAYYELGQQGSDQALLSRAEGLLAKAMRLDPALAPTARFYLAAVKNALKRPTEAQQELLAILKDSPRSPIGALLRDRLQQAGGSTARGGKPWHLSVTAGGGYNGNVINLASSLPLPTDVSHRDAGFGHFILAASYDFRLTPRDVVTAGYVFSSDVYDGLHGSDLIDHYGYGRYTRLIGSRLSASLQASMQRTDTGGKFFREQEALRQELVMRWNDRMATELVGTYSDSHNKAASIAAQNRSGEAWTLGVVQRYVPPRTRLDTRVGYTHTWNNSVGSDFFFESDMFSASLGHRLPFDVYGTLGYARVNSRYKNPNSIGGFVKRRVDEGTDSWDFSLTRPLLPWLSLYVNYDYTRADSNILAYRYTQHAAGSGFQARF